MIFFFFNDFLKQFFLARFMLHLVFLLHCSLQQNRRWISHQNKTEAMKNILSSSGNSKSLLLIEILIPCFSFIEVVLSVLSCRCNVLIMSFIKICCVEECRGRGQSSVYFFLFFFSLTLITDQKLHFLHGLNSQACLHDEWALTGPLDTYKLRLQKLSFRCVYWYHTYIDSVHLILFSKTEFYV